MAYTNINITINTGLDFQPNDFVRLVSDTSPTTTTTTLAPTTTTTTSVPYQEYVIDNGASGSSSSACSGSTTTSIVYALPANTTPIVGMFLYTNTALTTPFVGSAGWRKLVKGAISYAAEVDANGELTNYVTCP
jgi:hypothetical protein